MHKHTDDRRKRLQVRAKKPKSEKIAITHLAIGIDSQVTQHVVAIETVAE